MTTLGTYRHFKGGFYCVLFDAFTSDMERVVVYVSLQDGQIWTRPLDDWNQRVTWPDGRLRRRFIREDAP